MSTIGYSLLEQVRMIMMVVHQTHRLDITSARTSEWDLMHPILWVVWNSHMQNTVIIATSLPGRSSEEPLLGRIHCCGCIHYFYHGKNGCKCWSSASAYTSVQHKVPNPWNVVIKFCFSQASNLSWKGRLCAQACGQQKKWGR